MIAKTNKIKRSDNAQNVNKIKKNYLQSVRNVVVLNQKEEVKTNQKENKKNE